MGRITKGLTDREIRGAKPKDKRYMLYDGGGLVLEVMPSGRKYWRLKYRLHGKNKMHTIGEYPRISLAAARDEAFELKKLAKQQIDISLHLKKEEGKNKSFDTVTKEFFELKKQELADSYIVKQIRRYEIYIMPKIGSKRIIDIEKSEIINIIKSVKNTKTNTTKNTDKNETARRIFRLIVQILDYAVHCDYIEHNIAAAIDVNKILPKKQSGQLKAIVELKDVQTLYNAIVNDYKGYEIVLYALKFLALTALRPGNVVNLKWEWVQLDRDLIIFPATAMKNKKDFRLPLTQELKKILIKTKEMNFKSDYVFPSPLNNNKPLSNNTLNIAHKRLGYPDHNAHGWRSAFSTICYEHQREHGFGYEVIESQLAHNIGSSVKMAYLRSDFLEERRGLLEWWSSKLSCF